MVIRRLPALSAFALIVLFTMSIPCELLEFAGVPVCNGQAAENASASDSPEREVPGPDKCAGCLTCCAPLLKLVAQSKVEAGTSPMAKKEAQRDRPSRGAPLAIWHPPRAV